MDIESEDQAELNARILRRGADPIRYQGKKVQEIERFGARGIGRIVHETAGGPRRKGKSSNTKLARESEMGVRPLPQWILRNGSP